jgi:hypothetical protein
MDEKEEIFKNISPDCQSCRISLEKMAELIPIGCKEKKSKGDNYLSITRKDTHILIMETIGFDTDESWISRSHVGMAMKLVNLELGWKDIIKNSIDFDRMIVYGKLKWKYKLDDEEIQRILNIFPFDPKRFNKKYIPKDFDRDIHMLLA